jgi:hypothetical protein
MLLTSLIVFFGVILDMAHSGIKLGRTVDYLLAIAEDGGEMIAASLVLWYVFLINLRSPAMRPLYIQ